MAEVQWDGDAVLRRVEAHAKRKMNRVGSFLQAAIRASINVSNQGGTNPSQPFQPPHFGTRRLSRSIDFEVTSILGGFKTRVGTNVEYARRLEFGFFGTDSLGRNISQAPRPFLRRALAENQNDILRILLA